LKLKDSFGLAAQLGIDIDLTNDWYVNADARWTDIDTKAKVNGASIGKVHLDPLAFGVSVGRRF
jgi:outer membrane protein